MRFLNKILKEERGKACKMRTFIRFIVAEAKRKVGAAISLPFKEKKEKKKLGNLFLK